MNVSIKWAGYICCGGELSSRERWVGYTVVCVEGIRKSLIRNMEEQQRIKKTNRKDQKKRRKRVRKINRKDLQ